MEACFSGCESRIGGGGTSGTVSLPAFHLAPHALHSCDGPFGPRRHMGVFVLSLIHI